MKRLITMLLCAVLLILSAAPVASAEALEPIEFSIFHTDPARRIPPPDASIVKQVTDLTGVSLNWQVPPAEAIERLNIMLATDDMPDLIYFDDMTVMNHFIEAGKLLSLEELLKEHAPMYYQNTSHFHDRIRAKDDKMYFLPSAYIFDDSVDTRYFPETSVGFGASSELLKEMGWYNPDTYESILGLLREVKTRRPDMIPMGLALGPQGDLDNIKLIGAASHGLILDKGEWEEGLSEDVILLDDKVQYFTDVPQMKEWFQFLNAIYREGLMDIESPVMSKDMLRTKVVAEQVYAFFGGMGDTSGEFNALQQSEGSSNRLFNLFFPKANESIEKVTYAPYTDHLYTRGVAITTKCKDPERFMKFIEYLNSEEGFMNSLSVTGWDFEGENTFERTEGYDYIVLNDVEPIRPGLKPWIASAWLGEMWESDENWWWNVRGEENYTDFTYMIGVHPQGKYDPVGDMDVGMWWDEYVTEFNAAYGLTGLNFWEVQTALGSDRTMIASLSVEPESDAEIAKLTMSEYLKTQLPRIIIADTAEAFETAWQEMDQKLIEQNKQAYVDAKTALYEQRKVDWGL